ncbi:trypsin-like peptidase domain-containing protein [Streptomyces sp. NPDC048416]|uniref:S1C family serine protease n=1 Tax=Streptomyces sp. NPDC048416 TaxID=3365546 RepID=UPI0037202BF3
MNEQKPTGPRPKWWSRPQIDHPRPGEPPAPADAVVTPGAADPAEAEADTYDLAPPAAAADGPPPGSGAGSGSEPGHAEAVPASEVTHPEPTDPEPTSEEPTPEPAPEVGSSHPASAAPGVPQTERRGPLHAPDPYGTPPYGGPGPWAPAPPVQRPVPTPPGGTVLPPQPTYSAPQASVPQAPVPQAPAPHASTSHAPTPHAPTPTAPTPPHPPYAVPPQAGLQPAAAPQWAKYDPWGEPGMPGTPLGPVGSAGRPEPRKRRRGALLAGAVLLALVAGGIGGGVGAYVERNGGITSVHLPQAGKEPQGRAPDSVAGIAASALPSVVTIHVTGASESGTGTGFVLDNAGHILTNNHVVQPAGTSGKISVTFSGGESAAAEVVGRDAGYDLAVVKVDGVAGMKPLALGNSDNVMVGDPVVAIGAPFDLSNTVTSGIISAKERPITAGGESGDGSDVSYVDALQTDAPINPGNSGGPLVDSKARVIGINSAIRSAGSGSTEGGGQAGSIGLGFAIPVNQAKRVAEELINTGRATHPVIGVTLDMKYSGDGARVGDKASDGKPAVVPEGPGARAGIEAQDVITKVDGQRVHSAEELIVKIRAHRPGDRLGLTVLRGGKQRELTLTLGSAS